MLKAKDFRARAWESLRGKWGTMAIITLIYSLILSASSGLSFIGVGVIVMLLVEGPLSLGYVMMSQKIIRGQDVEIGELFDGFKNFSKAFVLSLVNSIYIFLWTLLFIIPGIIKSFSYSMSQYVLADHPEFTATEARQESMRLMDGNKWRLFCLQFSFIGWGLLTILTFGILAFWVQPYQQAATAAFYQSLVGDAASEQPAAAPETPFDELKQPDSQPAESVEDALADAVQDSKEN